MLQQLSFVVILRERLMKEWIAEHEENYFFIVTVKREDSLHQYRNL